MAHPDRRWHTQLGAYTHTRHARHAHARIHAYIHAMHTTPCTPYMHATPCTPYMHTRIHAMHAYTPRVSVVFCPLRLRSAWRRTSQLLRAAWPEAWSSAAVPFQASTTTSRLDEFPKVNEFYPSAAVKHEFSPRTSTRPCSLPTTAATARSPWARTRLLSPCT